MTKELIETYRNVVLPYMAKLWKMNFEGKGAEDEKEFKKDFNEILDAAAKTLETEEDVFKFYYVESIDDYWIGKELDTMYYATWEKGLGFVWTWSRYLPWGQHVVRPYTLWKEFTYPSEPVEMHFTEWIRGFVKKYFMIEEGET